MKKTKSTNCKFELHVKVKKLKVLERNANNITTQRRSIALRLGPNLRAIAPLETQNEIKICLFIHNQKSDVMPNLAYKKNQHRAVARTSKLQ